MMTDFEKWVFVVLTGIMLFATSYGLGSLIASEFAEWLYQRRSLRLFEDRVSRLHGGTVFGSDGKKRR